VQADLHDEDVVRDHGIVAHRIGRRHR
jgi:hypothetical protein